MSNSNEIESIALIVMRHAATEIGSTTRPLGYDEEQHEPAIGCEACTQTFDDAKGFIEHQIVIIRDELQSIPSKAQDQAGTKYTVAGEITALEQLNHHNRRAETAIAKIEIRNAAAKNLTLGATLWTKNPNHG